MPDIKVAVIGASGVVGRAMVEHLMEAGISVTGFSRRPPADLEGAPYLPLDLMDREACKRMAVEQLADITHIVYAALFEKPGLIPGWRDDDQMQTNLNMLTSILAPLQSGSALRHVTLLQGTKAYGAHVAPMKIPGLESDPRHSHENFYWLQEDYLKDTAAEAGWTYTIWRPQIIFGHALHAPMNMLAAIGVYAGLQQHKGLPLSYPGGPSAVTEAVDADLLAQAMAFAFDNPDCANQTFNMTNGDVFRWQDIWPVFGEIFQMETGQPLKRQLSDSLYQEEAAWQDIVNHHQLKPYGIRELVGDSFFYADALFNAWGDAPPPPALLSTIKLRQAGFQDCVDTTEMFNRWFRKLAALKVLPPLN